MTAQNNGWLKVIVGLLITLILGAYAFSYFALHSHGLEMRTAIAEVKAELYQANKALGIKLDCLIDGRFCPR